LRAQRLCERFQARFVAPDEREVRTAAGELERDVTADAAARAG
jgi:Mn-dependent DtxR family transcriptional regulator